MERKETKWCEICLYIGEVTEALPGETCCQNCQDHRAQIGAMFQNAIDRYEEENRK